MVVVGLLVLRVMVKVMEVVGVSSNDCCLESADSVLDSLSDSYSKLGVFLCKG